MCQTYTYTYINTFMFYHYDQRRSKEKKLLRKPQACASFLSRFLSLDLAHVTIDHAFKNQERNRHNLYLGT